MRPSKAPAAAAGGGETSAPSSAPQTPSQPSFSGLNFKQLKDELRARGISTTGMTERSELVTALDASAPVSVQLEG